MVTFDSTGYFTPVPQRDVPGVRNNDAKEHVCQMTRYKATGLQTTR
jgi:hypothetical protein